MRISWKVKEVMKFERLELENFASYYGNHTIDLATTLEKPVVVIIGGTGFGKTSLFDALNWSLYGTRYEEQIVKTRHRSIYDYVNEKAIQEAQKKKEFVSTSCTLYFEHEGFHFYISQEMVTKATLSSNGKISLGLADRTTSLYKISFSGNHERIEYNEVFLDEILPSNVRDYFLFDGDRIYQLSNPGSSKQVRDAIYRVVDLEILQNTIGRLREVETTFRREAKRESTDELLEVNEKYDEIQEQCEKTKNKLKTLNEEIEALRNQIKVKENILLKMPDARELQTQRNEINRASIELEEKDKKNAEEMRKLLVPAAMLLASEAASDLVMELEKQREMGTIPQKVSVQLLEDLLALGKCLCGNCLAHGYESRKVIEKRLEEERGRNSGEELLWLLYKLNGASTSTERARIRLQELINEHDSFLDEMRELNLILSEINSKLAALPQEDINKLHNELQKMRGDKDSLIARIERTKTEIEGQQKEIKDLENKREVLGQKQKKASRLLKREGLARRAAENLEKIYESFAEESRQSIETHTRAEFQRFVKSGSGYTVRLNNDYELEVLDSLGNPALSRLSMGQSQCLSLSFITSIAKVSEKNPPLVIDMPFGRLDRDVHEQVSKRLPELASQLILYLIPDIEWNDVTSSILKAKANHIYSLAFDEMTRETSIREVG